VCRLEGGLVGETREERGKEVAGGRAGCGVHTSHPSAARSPARERRAGPGLSGSRCVARGPGGGRAAPLRAAAATMSRGHAARSVPRRWCASGGGRRSPRAACTARSACGGASARVACASRTLAARRAAGRGGVRTTQLCLRAHFCQARLPRGRGRSVLRRLARSEQPRVQRPLHRVGGGRERRRALLERKHRARE